MFVSADLHLLGQHTSRGAAAATAATAAAAAVLVLVVTRRRRSSGGSDPTALAWDIEVATVGVTVESYRKTCNNGSTGYSGKNSSTHSNKPSLCP